jgi:hypothetical protein
LIGRDDQRRSIAASEARFANSILQAGVGHGEARGHVSVRIDTSAIEPPRSPRAPRNSNSGLSWRPWRFNSSAF